MQQAFEAQLANLDPRIGLEIRRMRLRYELSLDEFRGLYITDSQVDQLIVSTPAPAAPPTPTSRPADGARETDQAWNKLVAAFELTPLEEDLILIAAAPEFDPRYETLYGYLNNDVSRKWPTADLARRLLSDVAN